MFLSPLPNTRGFRLIVKRALERAERYICRSSAPRSGNDSVPRKDLFQSFLSPLCCRLHSAAAARARARVTSYLVYIHSTGEPENQILCVTLAFSARGLYVLVHCVGGHQVSRGARRAAPALPECRRSCGNDEGGATWKIPGDAIFRERERAQESDIIPFEPASFFFSRYPRRPFFRGK